MRSKVFCLLLVMAVMATLVAGELPATSCGERDAGTITGVVRNTFNQPIQGAAVSCGTVTAATNASGMYSMQIEAGTYSVTASHPDHQSATQAGVVVVGGQTIYCNFILHFDPFPFGFYDSFEDHEDFALEFAPWTCVDVDLSETSGISGVNWSHAGEPQAFIIFNPTATIPPLSGIQAYSGDKMAASFPATQSPSSDWLITPAVKGMDFCQFRARSLNADNGLERIKVGVSTFGTAPQSFIIISGAQALEVPASWTQYIFDLSGFEDEIVYVGIHHCTDGGSALLVDSFNAENVPVADDSQTPALTGIEGNFPNPFNPETNIRFSLARSGPVELGVFDLRGRKLKTLVNSYLPSGHHTTVWNGLDDAGRQVSSGVYLCKLRAGGQRSCHKLVLMK
ncbi:MAG TPA: choice-of-anchor J domain-containing protein [Candidatus Syntrophosphaera sp.]|nr:choice-of-anchor J domain-containing protein [Candidatus Syntrophosphaera sp.]